MERGKGKGINISEFMNLVLINKVDFAYKYGLSQNALYQLKKGVNKISKHNMLWGALDKHIDEIQAEYIKIKKEVFKK